MLAIPDSEPNEWDQWVEAIFRVFDIGGRDIGDIDPIDYPKTLEDFQKDTSIKFPRGYTGYVDKVMKSLGVGEGVRELALVLTFGLRWNLVLFASFGLAGEVIYLA